MIKLLRSILLALMLLIALPLYAYAHEDGMEHEHEEVSDSTEVNVDATVEIVPISADVEATEEIEVTSEVETTEVEATEVTTEEVEIISDKHGAEMRIAQLQRQLDLHITAAKAVIAELEASEDTKVDIDKLNEIVSELEAISVEAEGLSTDLSDDELKEKFLTLKSDAIALIGQFRETVKENISEEEREALKELAKEAQEKRDEAKDEKIEKLKERIEMARDNYNKGKLAENLKRLKNLPPELAQQVENGEITPDEARKIAMERLANLTPEERKDMIHDAREMKERDFNESRAENEELRMKVKDEFQNHEERAKMRFEEREGEVKQRIEMRDEFVRDKLEITGDRIRFEREGLNGTKERIRIEDERMRKEREGQNRNGTMPPMNPEMRNDKIVPPRDQEMNPEKPSNAEDLVRMREELKKKYQDTTMKVGEGDLGQRDGESSEQYKARLQQMDKVRREYFDKMKNTNSGSSVNGSTNAEVQTE